VREKNRAQALPCSSSPVLLRNTEDLKNDHTHALAIRTEGREKWIQLLYKVLVGCADTWGVGLCNQFWALFLLLAHTTAICTAPQAEDHRRKVLAPSSSGNHPELPVLESLVQKELAKVEASTSSSLPSASPLPLSKVLHLCQTLYCPPLYNCCDYYSRLMVRMGMVAPK
jgi:hypothetical protein